MKNCINIFLFYFITAMLNIWCENGAKPEMLWAIATEVIETEEKEREEHIKYDISQSNERISKGTGDGDSENEIIISDDLNTSVPLFNTLAPLTYSEESALKQYNKRLINSLYTPKLYILFRCPKTFLS